LGSCPKVPPAAVSVVELLTAIVVVPGSCRSNWTLASPVTIPLLLYSYSMLFLACIWRNYLAAKATLVAMLKLVPVEVSPRTIIPATSGSKVYLAVTVNAPVLNIKIAVLLKMGKKIHI
jgi:hypothetical protein